MDKQADTVNSSQAAGQPPAGNWLMRLRGKYSSWRQRQRAKREEKAFRRAYETLTDQDDFAPVKLRPIRRGPRRVMTWPGLLVRGLLLLLGGALLLAMFFPYDRYRPEIEQRLGAALGDQAKIAELRFSFLPYPNITLLGVSVGATAYAEVKAIRVIPELISLSGAQWVIRHARLEDLVLRRPGIMASAHWFDPLPGSQPVLILRRVEIERLSVEVADARLSGLSGEVRMRVDGGVDKILLHDAGRSLHLEATPATAGYRLSVLGNALKIPFKVDLNFDSLEAQGEITADRLLLRKLAGRIHGGLIEGTVQFDWSAAPSLRADIGLTRVSAGRLMAALNPEVSIEGNIVGKFHLESQAKDFAQLSDKLRVDGEFLAERGLVNRFDLMEAARSGRPTRGGFTRYERFSGTLQLDNNAWHLGRLKIDSGLVQAAGALDIGADSRLKGQMELDLRGSATGLNASLQIAGTLASPQLSATRSARR